MAVAPAPDPTVAEGVNTASSSPQRPRLRDRERGAHARRASRSSIRNDLDRADVELEPDVDHPSVHGPARPHRASPPAPRSARTPSSTTPRSAPALVGPFCYLRPGTVLEAGAKAGTFVEIKNSHVGEGEGAASVVHRRRRDRRGHERRRRATITANFPHQPDGPRAGRRSAATSARASTIRSWLRSRSATTLGSRRAPSSPRTSHRARSRSPAAAGQRRRAIVSGDDD